ncbi:hypothetical protein EMIT047CA2_140018 [Pseudomonas soli]
MFVASFPAFLLSDITFPLRNQAEAYFASPGGGWVNHFLVAPAPLREDALMLVSRSCGP